MLCLPEYDRSDDEMARAGFEATPGAEPNPERISEYL